jgi:hypothetical protein
MEKSLRMKAEALRDDENVFDVSFEGMGTVEATASATDVKVGGNLFDSSNSITDGSKRISISSDNAFVALGTDLVPTSSSCQTA